MKNRFVALFAMVAVITGLSSCLKNNVTPEAPTTVIYFINGSPAVGMDIYFNDKKANSSPFTLGLAVGDRFAPANIKIDFKKTGSDSLLTSVTANFDTLQYHTILLYGNATTGVESYNLREDFSDVSREKANVRFLNFVDMPEPVDFFIGTTKVSSRYYKDFLSNTDFQTADPSSVTITVKDQAGTELATLPNVTLSAFNAYSIAYVGVQGETGDKKPAIKVYQQ